MRLLVLLLMMLPLKHFGSSPYNTNTSISNNVSDSTNITTSLRANKVKFFAERKMNLAERLKWKILQKKLKRINAEGNTSKDTVSTIALVTGIAGFVLLFLVPLAGFVLLLTAIITGIIGRKNNENPKSRKKALIGLVLGLLAVGLILIFSIAYAGGF